MIKTIDVAGSRWRRGVAILRFGRIFLALVAVLLTSCSSGGGGGGDNNLINNPSATFLEQAVEPTAPFNAADWSGSQEYLNSTGLSQLKAAEGYARRAGGRPGGQGVRIAIIDSGIDLTHPDLGNLSGQSWSAGGEPLVGHSHATFVAGIAAASRTQTANPNDMHGLAYRATLVNFQAARPSVTASTGNINFSTADLVEAVNMASGAASGSANVESDILNLSLGAYSTSDSAFSSLRTAMRTAAAEGKIMVLAAGNEGLDSNPDKKLQPIYPAAYADDAGIAGHAIVVGNLTAGNQRAASSNLCGNTKNYCLFAPGTNIRSTLKGGSYGIGTGTSFSAPYVSGAAAVVKAAFPGVSSEDVVNRLLLTAQDLGDPGVDETFGRGLLDLEAAMAPVGPVSLPTGAHVDSATIARSQSSLYLGPAWSISDQGRALLESAVGFDQMGFPFPAALEQRIASPKTHSGLLNFISAKPGPSAGFSLPHATLSISAAYPEDDWRSADHEGPHPAWLEAERSTVPQISFNTEAAENVTLFASLNGTGDTELGLQQMLAERRLETFHAGLALSPFERLSGDLSGGGLALTLSEDIKIAISAYTNAGDGQVTEAAMQKIEFAKDFFNKVKLRVSLGLLQEEDGFLGASAAGAFGEELQSRSRFADL
ncbi:MAG: S8 family peptidase, partial [Geminicoccaceae bacterium]